jgi:tape measure domain-containing protein
MAAETRIIVTAKDEASKVFGQIGYNTQSLMRGFQNADQTLAGLDKRFKTAANSMVRDLAALQEGQSRSSLALRNWTTQSGELARVLGLNQAQFAALNQRFLQTQAAERQAQALRNIQRAAGLTNVEMKALAAQMNVSQAALARFLSAQGPGVGAQALGWGKAGLAALGVTLSAQMIGSAVRSVVQAALRKENIEVAFAAIEGGAEQARARLAFLRQESDRLGLSFYDTAETAKRFFASARGTEIEEQAGEIFTAFSEMGTALKLSRQDMNGVFLALGQMLSKGKVSAEELRTQLAERLPGTFQLMAKAIGVTTRELDRMLQRGEVGLDAVLRTARLIHSEYGGTAATAARGLQAEMNRVSTAWMDLKAGFVNTQDAASALRGINVILQGTLSALETIKARISDLRGQNGKEAGGVPDWLLTQMTGAGGVIGLAGYLTRLGRNSGQNSGDVPALERFVRARSLNSASIRLPVVADSQKLVGADATASLEVMREFNRTLQVRQNAVTKASEYTKSLAKNLRAEVEQDYQAVLETLTKAREAGGISAEEFARLKADLDATRAGKLETIDQKAGKDAREYAEAMAGIAARTRELTASESELEAVKVENKYADLAQKVGAANPALRELIRLEKEAAHQKWMQEGLWLKPEQTSAYDPDGVFAARKRRRELDRDMLRKTSEENLELQTEFAEKYRAVVLGETASKLEQIDRQAGAYRRAGADSVAVEVWAAQERLNVSRDAADGMTRFLRDYADSASDSAKQVETALGTAFETANTALTEFVFEGEVGMNTLSSAARSLFGQLTQMNLLGPLASWMSGKGASESGGMVSWIASLLPSAQGNVFQAPALSSLSGTLLTRPTVFGFQRHITAFAQGGLAGEAGIEGVFPITRTRSGKLGIQAEGGGADKALLQALGRLTSAVSRMGGTRIINTLDPSVVANYLSSSEGEKVILNTIRRNPDVLRK